jgi:hypothetical protein
VIKRTGGQSARYLTDRKRNWYDKGRIGKYSPCPFYAPIAQGIEHPPSKRSVAGSNPAGRAEQASRFHCSLFVGDIPSRQRETPGAQEQWPYLSGIPQQSLERIIVFDFIDAKKVLLSGIAFS